MKEFIRNTIFKLLIAAIMITILLTGGVTYAWLSTSWNGGNFDLTTAETDIPKLEVWASDDDSEWHVIYSDTADIKEKKIDKINEEGYYTKDASGNYTTTVTSTFTPIDDDDAIPLYFGTIRNLVEKQDNTPVYLRLAVTLPARSSNDIVVKCTLHGIRPYQMKDLSKTEGTDVSTEKITVDSEEINFSTYLMDQDFLILEYVQTDTKYDVDTDETTKKTTILTTESDALSFEDLFDKDENSELKSYSNIKGESGGATEATIEVDNTDTRKNTAGEEEKDDYGDPIYEEKTTYVYFKFSIETDALRSSIDQMQKLMPLYLIFDVDLDIEVRNTYLS